MTWSKSNTVGCVQNKKKFWFRTHSHISPANKKNIFITFVQCRTNVEDVGPTLYKCYTNVLCLLGAVYFHSFEVVHRCNEKQRLQKYYCQPSLTKSELCAVKIDQLIRYSICCDEIMILLVVIIVTINFIKLIRSHSFKINESRPNIEEFGAHKYYQIIANHLTLLRSVTIWEAERRLVTELWILLRLGLQRMSMISTVSSCVHTQIDMASRPQRVLRHRVLMCPYTNRHGSWAAEGAEASCPHVSIHK